MPNKVSMEILRELAQQCSVDPTGGQIATALIWGKGWDANQSSNDVFDLLYKSRTQMIQDIVDQYQQAQK